MSWGPVYEFLPDLVTAELSKTERSMTLLHWQGFHDLVWVHTGEKWFHKMDYGAVMGATSQLPPDKESKKATYIDQPHGH